jgi:hypothetical protein
MRIADYSQSVTVDQLDAALLAGGFEAVFHYLAGTPGFVLRIEDPAVVAGIREKGWPQLGIDVPRLPPDVDGAATAERARQLYGCPPGFEIYLDIEPAQFVLDRAGWPPAADRWSDGIRAAGYVPGIYGTDETVAVCANNADRIWRAKPGQCDPAGPGLEATFFAGRRIVQCDSGVWGGVEFDVSFSQFMIGGAMGIATAASDGDLVAFHHLIQFFCFGAVDPSGQQDFVNTVRAGVPLNAIMDGWLTLPQSQAWLKAVANLAATEAAVAHLQSAGAPGVDPAALRAVLAKLAADQQQVLADLEAAAQDPNL